MKKIVFLVEEPCMREFLNVFLERLLPSEVFPIVVPHEGKQDLEKSIPRKLRAWGEPGVRFVVVRDQDSADCKCVKKKLAQLCADAGRPESLVRIVCTELESWYLGDLQALAEAYGLRSVGTGQARRKFRNPDALSNAAQELKKLVPSYQKRSGARTIAGHLVIDRNVSPSFMAFVKGVLRIADELVD